jgi:hypothetical protein
MSMGQVGRTWLGSDLLKRHAQGLPLTLCGWEIFPGLAAAHMADVPITSAPRSVHRTPQRLPRCQRTRGSVDRGAERTPAPGGNPLSNPSEIHNIAGLLLPHKFVEW